MPFIQPGRPGVVEIRGAVSRVGLSDENHQNTHGPERRLRWDPLEGEARAWCACKFLIVRVSVYVRVWLCEPGFSLCACVL